MSAPGRLRIVYVWDADYPWDVRTEKICAALTGAGHAVHIVARNREWRAEREAFPEGTVHRMRPWRLLGRRLDGALGFPAFFSPRWRSLLDRTIRDVRADLVIVRDLPLCPTAIWAARRHRVPVILDMAENYPATIRLRWTEGLYGPLDFFVRNPGAVAAVERYCLPRVDATLVVIEESGERLAAMGVPEDRIAVVSNTPARARAFDPVPDRARAPSAPLEIVYLGLLELPRGLDTLVDAIAVLKADAVPARLSLIGAGLDHERLAGRVRGHGLTPSEVVFHGFVPSHEQARALVAAADVGAVPHPHGETWNTTIPNKLFDYMAAALPVISSDAAPLARIVGRTGAGEIFRSRDARDMARALTRLRDPAARATMGAAGRRAIRDHFHWERDAAVLIEAVERVGARRRRRVPMPTAS